MTGHTACYRLEHLQLVLCQQRKDLAPNLITAFRAATCCYQRATLGHLANIVSRTIHHTQIRLIKVKTVLFLLCKDLLYCTFTLPTFDSCTKCLDRPCMIHDPTPSCHQVFCALRTSQLKTALIRWLFGSLMCLVYSSLSEGVCTTRHRQTSGRLVQELNVCTLCADFKQSNAK